ncbi:MULTISPECIES: pyridoxamine 5'-phosphate oxidase family protein [Kitasatospora]|uniref:Pyridoxamine 5'-phosphate oxidase family protein n=1 Tax=Kitasatospora cystarginea TaxID=58350 RepID=A0ABP5R9D2_9ACTN
MKPELPWLAEQRCLTLLESASVGRVVYTVGALPAVLPARFRLDEHGVVLRADGGEALVRAVDGSLVAFEADHVDTVDGSGWSVTVLGPARVITLPGSAAADRTAHSGQVEIRIRPELVTGRTLSASRH